MSFKKTFPELDDLNGEDCPTFKCDAEKLPEVFQRLYSETPYKMLLDATAIDNGEEASPRFTAVYHLLHAETFEYLRLKSDCNGDEEPSIPSISGIYKAANWHERETYDMFGIRYEGHPDLRRILMWDGYEYFPLRKEFPLAGVDSDYPEEDIVERTELGVKPAPMVGGPFVAAPDGPMSKKEPRAKDQSWRETKPKAGA